jgi:pilus assembly protein CpaC
MRIRSTQLCLIITLIAVAAAWPSGALSERRRDRDQSKRVQVAAGSTYHFETDDRITSVTVASGAVAEVNAFPPNKVAVTGKGIGVTTATIWHGATAEVVVIEVTHPLDLMRDALRKALPGAEDIDVQQAGRSVVLSGRVASAADVERAEEIVAGYTEGAKIVNLLAVPGDQQVQIEVSFAEVSRSALRQVGFNFWGKGAHSAGGLLAPTNSLTNISPQLNGTATRLDELNSSDGVVPLVAAPLSGTFGAIFSTALGDFPFSAAVSLLSNRGFARVLAEPTLVALSGESAGFLAGGEFPIPLPQSLGQVAVDFKKFGIQLDFTPTVVGDDIQISVGVTVSDIDFSLGVKLASTTVPGLTSRHAATTVRVKDGQSFVIAGLLSDRVRSSVDKVPGLGSLPVLGALFRSTSYRREETELLVVVTAHRVRPQNERPQLPGADQTVDPSDLELFLLGHHEALHNDDSDTNARSDAGADDQRERRRPRRKRGNGQDDVPSPLGPLGFKR